MPKTQEISTFDMRIPGVIVFPDLCCYCGAPAVETFDFGAQVEGERYRLFTGQRIKIKVGAVLPIKYCAVHYQKALHFRKELVKYYSIDTNVGLALMGICMLLLSWYLVAVHKWGIVVGIIVGVIAGFLLYGALSIVFDPLFSLLNRKLLSMRLEPEIRLDLSAHMKAQGQNPPWWKWDIPYTLGISIKYDTHATRYAHPAKICLTNPKYARILKRKNLFALSQSNTRE